VNDLLVLIPALNEEEAIAGVVGRTLSALPADVLVIDDGSTDETSVRARAAGALVVRHPFNLGVGAAIRTGLRFAHERGYQYVVQIDGDGQHDPLDAEHLVAVVRQGDHDLSVGSRFANGYRVAAGRRVAMRILAGIVSRKLGRPLTDATSGFRAFGPKAIAVFAGAYPTEYLSDTVEALLLAADAGLRVVEVPVTMRERQGGEPSARLVKSSYHLVRLCVVIALHGVRRPMQRREPHPAGRPSELPLATRRRSP
jgi:glycosyltransferase involved in cell wall biosynthesis